MVTVRPVSVGWGLADVMLLLLGLHIVSQILRSATASKTRGDVTSGRTPGPS